MPTISTSQSTKCCSTCAGHLVGLQKHPKIDGVVFEEGGADETFELEVQSNAHLICIWI